MDSDIGGVVYTTTADNFGTSIISADLLAPQKLLAEATDNGFLLTTKQLAEILGIKQKGVISNKGDSFRAYGFVFTRHRKERKKKQQVLWVITREAKGEV